MSVALAPELWEEVRAAADRAGKSTDDWFADAAETKLRAEEAAATVEEAARKKRHQALGEYLDEWEAEHGAALAASKGGRQVSALVLDAGALVAIDRDDRSVGQGPARRAGAACYP